MDIDQLAIDWIREQREKATYSDEQQSEGNPPAIEKVIMLSIEEPELLWRFILSATAKPDIKDVIGTIGAGPLEDLIADYGDVFYERIQSEAAANPLLAEALQSVWVAEEVKPTVDAYTKLGCTFVSATAT